jgi:hypothetical protein
LHPFDERLVALEREQHGLTALHQLRGPDGDPEPTQLAAGTHARITHRVRGRRTLVQPRVFANPSVAPTFRQHVLAAVLSAGEGARASHEAAAHLWELPLPGPALLEVTTSLTRRPLVRGVRMHRSGLLEEHDSVVLEGIPVVTPELAVYSLSSRFGLTQLGRMTDDGVRRQIMTLDRLSALVDRLPPAPGRSRRKMRTVLSQRAPGVEDRESYLEDFVFAAIMRYHLPPPVPQHPVVFDGRQRRIDLCYPEDWLALEAKGFAWYRTRSVFDRDALRGNDLQLAGFRVLSFTSAFTDYEIASQVARALALLPPKREDPPLTYAQWSRRR